MKTIFIETRPKRAIYAAILEHDANPQDTSPGDMQPVSGNNTYNYAGVHPHAVTSLFPGSPISKTFTYDNNGNLAQANLTNDYRTMIWDEENHIKTIVDSSIGGAGSESYWYDNQGQRKIKVDKHLSAPGYPWDFQMYPNQYASYDLSATNTVERITKSIYVGNQRLACKINVAGYTTDYVYYFGTDHLGSTTYLTDNAGNIVEHVEYTPWAGATRNIIMRRPGTGATRNIMMRRPWSESWWEQSIIDPVAGDPSTKIPFRFTGKEQDRTGLYYYGARYYDPVVSTWVSPDPALEKYFKEGEKWAKEAEKSNFTESSGKGTFESKNLAMYSYAHQNPMIMLDPDGNDAAYAFKTLCFSISDNISAVTNMLIDKYENNRSFSELAENHNHYFPENLEQDLMDWATSTSGGNSYWSEKMTSPISSKLYNDVYGLLDDVDPIGTGISASIEGLLPQDFAKDVVSGDKGGMLMGVGGTLMKSSKIAHGWSKIVLETTGGACIAVGGLEVVKKIFGNTR